MTAAGRVAAKCRAETWAGKTCPPTWVGLVVIVVIEPTEALAVLHHIWRLSDHLSEARLKVKLRMWGQGLQPEQLPKVGAATSAPI